MSQAGPTFPIVSEDYLDFLTIPERLKLSQCLRKIQEKPAQKDQILAELTENEKIKLERLATAISTGGRNASTAEAVDASTVPDAKPILPAYQKAGAPEAGVGPNLQEAQPAQAAQPAQKKNCCNLL